MTKLLENVNTKDEIYSAEFNREEVVDFKHKPRIEYPLEEYFSNYDKEKRKETPERDIHLAIHRIPEENIKVDATIPTTISKLLKNLNKREYTAQAKGKTYL